MNTLNRICFCCMLLCCMFADKLNAQNTWASIANVSTTGRAAAASFVIGNKAYITCGNNYPNTNTRYSDLWEYDLTANTWTQKASAPGPVAYTSGFAIGGKGYVCCGSGGTEVQLYEYNQATDTWSTKANFPGVSRTELVAFSIGAKGYVGLGRNGSSTLLNDFYEYDPSTDTWTVKTNYPGGGTYHAIAFSIGSLGLGYVGGGCTSTSSATSSSTFYEYNPASNAWTSKAGIPAGLDHSAGAAVGHKGYFIAGYNNGSKVSTTYEYDPVTNAWTTRLSFPGGNTFLNTAFGINGKMYSGTGYTTSVQSTVFAYTPANQLSVSALSSTLYCPGATVTIPYTSIGISFAAGNVFTVQLSDANGQWGSPTSIGTTTTTTANGNISCTMPAAAAGKGYRIRIISSNPSRTGGDNGTSLQIEKPTGTSTPSSQAICTGGATSVALSSSLSNTSYTWTVSQASGITGGSNCASSCGTSIAQTLNNSNTTGANATYTITPLANGCSGNTFTATITVNPKPVATSTPLSQAICSGTATSLALSSTVSGTSYTWTVAQASGITGASNCASSCGTSIAQTLSNSNATSATATYTVTPVANSCAGNTTNIVVSVVPKPTGSASPQTICSGQATSVALSSTVSGTTYTWTAALQSGTATGFSNQASGSVGPIVQTLTNTTASAAVVRYTVIPTASSCSGNTFTVDVTVNPRPTATSTPSSQTICSGNATSLALSSNVSGTSYTWTVVPASGITGGSNCASSCGTAIAQTLSNSNTTSATATYTITPTANSCTGNTANAIVTINPKPTGSASPQTICSGQATSVSLSSNVSGTTYTWTAALQSGTATGFSNQGAAVSGPIAQTLTNSTASAAVVRYTVTPLASSCSGNTFTVDVTVNPIPVASASAQNICSGASTAIPLSSTVSGTGYTWTVAQPGGIIGGSNCASSCGTSIAQTLSNSSANAATAIYTVTPVANSCTGNSINVNATVNPKPIGSALPQNICSGQTTSVGLSSTVSGTTYTWTAALQSGTATGFSNQNTGVSGPIVQTLTNTTANTAVVRYTVTPLAAGCSGNTFTVDVTVNPIPSGSASAQTICSGQATSVALSSNISGSTYTWTAAVQGGTATGFSNQNTAVSGPIAQILTNTTTATSTAIVRYTVTPVAAGCSGNPFTVDITIKPIPTFSLSPTTNTICSGEATDIHFGTDFFPIALSWTVNQSSGISGAVSCSSSCGGNIFDVLTNSLSSAGTATYNITATYNGCTSIIRTSTYTVNPVATGSVSNVVTCSGAPLSVTLNSTSSGALFTWTAQQLSGATISGFSNQSSATAGPLTQTLTNASDSAGSVRYTVTPSVGSCIGNSYSFDVQVRPSKSVITTSGSTSICAGQNVVLSNSTGDGINMANPMFASANAGTTICDCPPGYVVVGMQGRTGDWIDQFSLLCKKLNANGTLGSTTTATTFNGTSTGGNVFGPYYLPQLDNNVMVASNVTYSGGNISSIAQYGKPVSSFFANNDNTSGLSVLYMYGNSTTGTFGSQYMPNGSLITGMISNNTLYSTGIQWRYKNINRVNETYLWSNGATTNNIAASQAGAYTLTVTDLYGCNAVSNPVTVTTTTQPIITAAAGDICKGSTKTLTSSAASNNVWSNAATTQSIAALAGIYSVTVNGCSSLPYTVKEKPLSGIILNSGVDSICSGTSTDLTADIIKTDTINLAYGNITNINAICNSIYPYSYCCTPIGLQWTDTVPGTVIDVKLEVAVGFSWVTSISPSLNGSPSVNVSAPYNNNCSPATPGNPTLITLPATSYLSNAVNNISFINGYYIGFSPEALFNGNYGRLLIKRKMPSASLLWSTGQTSNTITVNATGNYTVTISDTSGCSYNLSKSIYVRPLTPLSITRNFTGNFCPPGELTASAANGYLWNTGSTNQTINIDTSGHYVLTITDAYGCTNSTFDNVISGAQGDTSVFGNKCWNIYAFAAGIADISNQAWSTNYSGYYVDSTFSFDTENKWGNLLSPSSASGYSGCPVPNENHSWSAKRKNFDCGYYTINVPSHDDAAQLFINGIKVWEHNGCCDVHTNVWTGIIDSLSKIEFRCTEGGGASLGKIEILPVSFTLNYPGATNLCTGDTANVSVNPFSIDLLNYNFQWMDGNVSLSRKFYATQNVYAQISSSACVVRTDTIHLIKNTTPVISAVDTLPLCQGSSKTLTASTAGPYLWSTGATTQSINATQSGNYSVTVNGCSSASFHQIVNPVMPGKISNNTNDSICTGATAILTAQLSSNDTINLNLGEMVNQYVSCNGFTSKIYGAPIGFQWNDVSLFPVSNVQLVFSNGMEFNNGGYVYTTSLNNINGPTYPQTVFHNYCFSTPVNNLVTLNLNPGSYLPNSTNIFLITNNNGGGFINTHAQLNGNYGRVIVTRYDNAQSYLWSTGATTASISVTTSGTYTCTIADNNGCIRQVSKTIYVDPLPSAAITKSFPGGLCGGGQLSVPVSSSYLWSNSQTTRTINISNTGIYTVTVTNSRGCSSSSSITIVDGVTGNPSVFGNNKWNVYAYNDGNGLLYYSAWSYNYAGYYVYDSLNFSTLNSWPDSLSPSSAPGYQGCPVAIDNHSWTAKRKGFPCGYYSLSIPNHDDAMQLYVNGVLVAQDYGCCDAHNSIWRGMLDSTSTVEFRVTEGVGRSQGILTLDLVIPAIAFSGNNVICTGGSVQAFLNPAPSSNSFANILWSNGNTDPSININSTQTISAQLSTTAGCIVSTTSQVVTQSQTPVITVSDTLLFCPGTSKTLTSSLLHHNIWSTGDTTKTTVINSAGTYTVANSGCSASVTIDQVMPVKIITNGPDSICPGYTELFTAKYGTIDTVYIDYSVLNGMYEDCLSGVTTNYNGAYTPQLYWYDYSIYPPSSIKVEFAVGIDCGTDSIHSLSFNGVSGPTFQRKEEHCDYCLRPDSLSYYSLNLPVSSYRLNDYNFIDFSNINDFGLLGGTPAFGSRYGRIIIDRTRPYSNLLWSTGATTQTISVSTAGTYTATVTNSDGCVQSVSKSIGIRPLPIPTITRSFAGALCPPGSLRAPLGYPSYQWSNGAITRVNAINNPGTYTVTVADQLGCSASASTVVISGAPGNPSVPGNNCWNVYTYNYGRSDFDSLTWNTGYSGYYVDSSFNINTELNWSGYDSPSDAVGYQGCYVSYDNHAWAAKRKGFPCGIYHINIPTHDDAAILYVNGNKVWEDHICCDEHLSVWTGILDQNSIIDYRVTEGSGFSVGKLDIILDTLKLHADRNSYICSGQSVIYNTTPVISYPQDAQYLWSDNSVNDSLNINTSSTVYLQLSNQSTCILHSDTVTVVANAAAAPVPVLNNSGNINLCDSASIILNTGMFTEYLWNDSSVTNAVSITKPGKYYVTVTNAAGCTATSDTAKINYRNTPANPVVTINSSVCAGTSATLNISGNYAPYGQALSLNGNGSVEVYQNIPESNFTIEMWIKTSEANTGIFSASYYNGDHDRDIYLKDGELYMYLYGGGNPWTTGIKNLNDNQWHHIAFTTETGIGQKVFVDGHMAATNTSYDHSEFSWQNMFIIGYSASSSGYNQFKGMIDNVRIWNSVRTSTEIRNNYTLSNPLNNSTLIASYMFNGNLNASVGNSGNQSGTISYSAADYYTYSISGTGAPAASTSSTQITAPLYSNTNYTIVVSVDGGYCPTASVNAATVIVNQGAGQVAINDTLFCVNNSLQPLIVYSHHTLPFVWQIRKEPATTWTTLFVTSDTLKAADLPLAITDTGSYHVRTFSQGAASCDSISNVVNYKLKDCSTFTLSVKVYIQGFYVGSGMMIPALYDLGLSNDLTECDTISISLRDPLSPDNEVYLTQTILHTDGTASVEIPAAFVDELYYIVVRHRNSIETWSKDPVMMNSQQIIFDFTR